MGCHRGQTGHWEDQEERKTHFGHHWPPPSAEDPLRLVMPPRRSICQLLMGFKLILRTSRIKSRERRGRDREREKGIPPPFPIRTFLLCPAHENQREKGQTKQERKKKFLQRLQSRHWLRGISCLSGVSFHPPHLKYGNMSERDRGGSAYCVSPFS